MLNSEELNRIYQQAYVPEHLPEYVAAISGAKPHLIENYLCFSRKNHIIFIGYPLGEKTVEISQVYDAVCKRFNPQTVAVITTELFFPQDSYEVIPADQYYRLNLPVTSLGSDVAYMVRRAERELDVEFGKFDREHKKMIKDFVAEHELTDEQVYIFKHVGDYVKGSKTAMLLEARLGDRLVAFSIMDTGSASYAFYLFNFRSTKLSVPGASDLLFKEMIQLAQSEEKQAINLGLGIHAGIRRFKEKWGGVPFLKYNSALVHRKPVGLGKLANKL